MIVLVKFGSQTKNKLKNIYARVNQISFLIKVVLLMVDIRGGAKILIRASLKTIKYR